MVDTWQASLLTPVLYMAVVEVVEVVEVVALEVVAVKVVLEVVVVGRVDEAQQAAP